ncbi:MAG: efflux RND transporter periplasmic adaptor subunit [Paracoccaceae bacterium]
MRAIVPTFLAPLMLAALPAGAQSAFDDRAIACTIKPLRVVELSSSTPGVVAEVLVAPGTQVREGQPLALLDDRVAAQDMALAQMRSESDADLRAARQRVGTLQSTVSRLERGFAARVVSAAQLEAARLDLRDAQGRVQIATERQRIAQAELQRARAVMDQLTLRSPVAGVVGEDLVDPGEAVGQGIVATIYVNQPLRVEAFVPAAQLADFVGRSDGYGIVVNDDAANPRTVRFDYAAQVADLASNTISVFFTLDAPDVLAGSKCEIAG